MTRSRASAKAASTRFASSIAAELAARLGDDRIERRAATGAKDRGDITGLRHYGQRIVVECKDYGGRVQVGPWLNEAEIERGNDDAGVGMVIAKRRGTTDPAEQVVLMTVRDLVSLLTGERPGGELRMIHYQDDAVTVYHGDCLDVLRTMPDASVDAVVTDPPYSLSFMGKVWDAHPTPLAFQHWCQSWAEECLRVLKPGGWLLAFGGTRTAHRLTCGIEDAGFQVRDSIADLSGGGAAGSSLVWLYGSGFP